jgi:hypothetical protein
MGTKKNLCRTHGYRLRHTTWVPVCLHFCVRSASTDPLPRSFNPPGPPRRRLTASLLFHSSLLLSPPRQDRMAGGSPAWGPSPALATTLVALLGLGLAAYIVGPPLYWHAAEALAAAGACPACDCDCDARPLLDLPEGSRRLSLDLAVQELPDPVAVAF